MSQEKKQKQGFEQALSELQDKVKALESGELSLEDSLKNFEEGVKLIRFCQEQLNVAEQKVEILLKDSNQGQTEEDAEAVRKEPFTADRPYRGK